MRFITENWKYLNQSIYVGERLEENMKALLWASIFICTLSLYLIIMNLFNGNMLLAGASLLTFLHGFGCGYCVVVLKNRNLAVIFPTVFCVIVFTTYAITGIQEGTAMLWSILLPIGMCYFVNVKYGILLSLYYSVLYSILFYSPLQSQMSLYYSESFMDRFPLIYTGLSIFTSIAMIQYHKNALIEIEYNNRLNSEVERQTQIATERAARLEDLNDEMIMTLALAVDAKDKDTNGHSFRVSEYTVALARALGLPEEEVKDLRQDALLHDIGKIGIPDSVLNKPERLTDEEYRMIQSHTEIGYRILSISENLLDAAEVARYHHERYDGKGYPDGLSGEEIPVHARIVAIADSYDAMRYDRVYRKGLPIDYITNELRAGCGTQFDPHFAEVFLGIDSKLLDQISEMSPPKY